MLQKYNSQHARTQPLTLGSGCDALNEYEKDGRCCQLCRPGQCLVTDCTVHNKTVCRACPAGEYQDKSNRETSCLLHRECNEQLGFEKISEGTPTSNVDCRCQWGKHCSSAACETCALNKACGKGEGVIQKATSISDTQCSPCNEGTFSDTESETETCKNWSKCGEAMVIKEPGTLTSDVICEPSTDSQSNTWVYIVFFLVAFVALSVPAIILYRKLYRKDKNKKRQDPPEENDQQEPINLKENLPEEDQDDQDITMQGLPVAQEQGKDYHMSQEEV
ncbi:tumor necrosis factor receptor superfamily member 5 isoform X2 [Hyla sarda]|uniref:tumor necrosis factor receptor superfamily member 5 isoform X2 n=1 Tax=Hyla sarda TaxID=327740 RepID=UPI0024C2959A|nr:tumor necrosis factor receptor superfamily member 5 isoform X2 [Hyla sarda]